MSSTATTLPSANWLALKRRSLPSTSQTNPDDRPFKRRKISTNTSTLKTNLSTSSLRPETSTSASGRRETIEHSKDENDTKVYGKAGSDPDSKENLAAMILSPTGGKERAKLTKFIAMDCEMVGVGPFGLENALARVSIVNFVGDVVLDEFVLPQETVVDWRTAVSGVRKEDMVHAKSFREIQNIVSDLLKDRFLVGHALQSDLSALLLSHPWQHLRDTQSFHPLRQIAGSRRPALRKLVNKVFGIQIQQGEHNSIIDARAPMALYRLYRKQWEGGNKLREPIEVTISPPMSPASVVSMPASTTVVTARSSSPTPSHSSSSSTKSKAASSINSDTKAMPKQTKPKQPDIIISIDKKSAKSSSKKAVKKVIEPQPITRKKTTGKTATGTRPKGKGSASANPMSSRIKKSSGSRVDEEATSGAQRKSWWTTLGI